MKCLDHDRLAEEFFSGLLTQLRNHGTEQDCLETWVPDENPVKSVLNMVEAVAMAGRNAVGVALESSRLAPEQVTELTNLLERLGYVEVNAGYDRLLVTVKGLQDEPRLKTLPVSLRRLMRPHVHSPAYQGDLPDCGAETISRTIKDPEDESIQLSLCFEPAGVRTILAARHSGAVDPILRGALDALCEVIERRPLQEAYEHGALRALYAVKEPDLEAPVAGIVLPANVHPAFEQAKRLIRLLLSSYLNNPAMQVGDNVYEPQPSVTWLDLSDTQRLSTVSAVVDNLLADLGETAGTLQVCGVENNLLHQPVRVMVAFASAPRSAPAALLRALEGQLQRKIEPTLQILHQALQDNSKIRRLSSVAS
jgi:hypothetical protein